MTIYEFSVITSDGFPYHQLKIAQPPNGVKLSLRFYDFSKSEIETADNLNAKESFELNAGLVSALFKFAKGINKKINALEFYNYNGLSDTKKLPDLQGNVLITAQTESFLLDKSVYEKIKLIYQLILRYKIPLDSALEMLNSEEKKIKQILSDQVAKSLVAKNKSKIKRITNGYFDEMEVYGLNGICIASFDLSPILVFGKKYSLDDITTILRNIGNIPEISPLEWKYRQSSLGDEQIWVYIYKSDVGPTVEGLFEPYFYLLFSDPQSYLGELPGLLGVKLNQILG